MHAKNLVTFRRRLLSWFDQHHRDLPWRRDRDPYKIWVSEVMLQQTTVAAVIPYFQKFIEAFPTVHSLAAAEEQQVLHLWQGLGYYRRARHLHQASRLLAKHAHIPDDPAAWAELPGVGKYILGAVLSQAFERRMPIVEANITRVLCRLFEKSGEVKSKETQKWLWETASKLLPRRRVGDFNQALMELGQRICTPSDPKCHDCPLRRQCSAAQNGTAQQIPTNSAKPGIMQVNEVAVVLRRGKQYLLAQRPANAPRWQSMWEFPQTELLAKESHEQAAQRLVKNALGLKLKLGGELATIRYAVTRFRMTMVALEGQVASNPVRRNGYSKITWVAAKGLSKYPMSTAQRKIAIAITAGVRKLF